jgi:chemotaxis family two-component system response regulator PixG
MTLTWMTEELYNLSKYNTDGELILRNNTSVWSLHLVRGQLLYATDRHHPVRRWDRAIKQHRLNWKWRVESSQLTDNQSWECQLLIQGLSQKQLSLIQAKLLIRSVVKECLFELTNNTNFTSDWKPSEKATSVFHHVVSLSVALSAKEMQMVLSKAEQIQRQWQAAGLGHLRPTLSPTLHKDVNSQTLPVLQQYLNGTYTLWDIALLLDRSVTELTCSLVPLAEKGILQFKEILDLPSPITKQPVAATPPSPPLLETKATNSSTKQPLIACIDDSPVLAHTLKKILMSAGYHMLSIPEPMRGFSQLIEHKPDLILLDLLLPNADGYSICKFLRETPVFKKTPIVILTAKNTPIDRARARLAGATDFLGKPPQPQELVPIIQKYLSNQVI